MRPTASEIPHESQLKNSVLLFNLYFNLYLVTKYKVEASFTWFLSVAGISLHSRRGQNVVCQKDK